MIPRRQFLGTAAMSAAFIGLARYLHGAESSRVISPYGPLRADPEGLLDLPEGFHYRVISETGRRMDDGLKVPGKPDGMAAFDGGDDKVILVCNHELALKTAPLGPFPNNNRFPDSLDRALSYDPGEEGEPPHLGGTTNLLYNPSSGKTEAHFLSLTGTDRNCAGGPTPWGTWITCEEPENLTSARGRKHGYCFEVQATADGRLQKAVALKALGRFRHEAVAVDPVDGSLYLTEDRTDGLLYRFVPDRKGDLRSGRLFALALVDRNAADLRNYDPESEQVPEGKAMPVKWIEMKEIDAPIDDLRVRGYRAGAARFARGEGLFYSQGAIYMCATDGGARRQGQIYRLRPRHYNNSDPALDLFLQPEESDLLTNGDNLCAAPGGHLIICEDLVNEHSAKTPHLRGITPDGEIYTLARNAKNKSEFAGSAFSPDGRTLFVNIQTPGITFAITGPWT